MYTDFVREQDDSAALIGAANAMTLEELRELVSYYARYGAEGATAALAGQGSQAFGTGTEVNIEGSAEQVAADIASVTATGLEGTG